MILAIPVADVGNDTVGSISSRIANLNYIRTIDGVQISPCRRSIRTRHTRHLLVHCVGVGCRDVQVLDRLRIQLDTGSPSVTLMVVCQHTNVAILGVIVPVCLVRRIQIAVIGSCNTCPRLIRILLVPVIEVDGIDILGIGKLTCQREWEFDGQLIVDTKA